MLSHNIKSHISKITGDWYISEKYDGIRAIWTGTKLITRSGREFNFVPISFLKLLPKGKQLDGELLVLGKPFSYFSAITVRKTFDERWNEVTYMVFDEWGGTDPFYKRLKNITRTVNLIKSPTIQVAEFTLIKDVRNNMSIIHNKFKEITNQGGEGIMLINYNNKYTPKRTKELLKYKKDIEDECTVSGFVEGTGKYKGIMGALICTLPNGAHFHVGSGFTDEQRKCYRFKDGQCVKVIGTKKCNAPRAGDTITYHCMEINKKSGIPRMPIFKSVRYDLK